jgi:hypothetical protein
MEEASEGADGGAGGSAPPELAVYKVGAPLKEGAGWGWLAAVAPRRHFQQ